MQAKPEKQTRVEYLIRNQALQGQPGRPGREVEATGERRRGDFSRFLYIVRSVMFLEPGRGENVGKIEKIMGKLQ
jgi:hypothetical protein